jgi:hypothetical protein
VHAAPAPAARDALAVVIEEHPAAVADIGTVDTAVRVDYL